jgi:YOP proteins translocation protein K (YscK)
MNDGERIRAASANDVAALLGGGLPGELVETLIASPRFAARLRAAALHRLESSAGELSASEPTAVAALALTPDGLSGIVLRAGAIWHAAAIARIVEASSRRRLMASLGPDIYAIALEARSLAPAEAIAPPDMDDWFEAVMRHGAFCWSAWRTRQPPAVASRLALLGRNDLPERIHEAFGPAIVDWLLVRP